MNANTERRSFRAQLVHRRDRLQAGDSFAVSYATPETSQEFDTPCRLPKMTLDPKQETPTIS